MATFGKLEFDGVSDDILALYFPAPHSFTGENVVELQVHGGFYLGQSIVNKLIDLGARLAERGEFSKRAVLNGKMDLSQAEGIIDMINANSLVALKTSASLMRGVMKQRVEDLQAKLTDCLCEINVALDYPEHDIEYITAEKVGKICSEVLGDVDAVLKTAHTGGLVRNGVRVALAGKSKCGEKQPTECSGRV